MKNKILLIGGTGLLGNCLLRYLNYNKIYVDSPTSKQFNILNINNFLNYEIIIHFGEYCHNGCLLDNMGLKNIIQNSPKKCKIIYASSIGVNNYISKTHWQLKYNENKKENEKLLSHKDLIIRFPFLFSKYNIKNNSIFYNALNDKITYNTMIKVLDIDKNIEKIWLYIKNNTRYYWIFKWN